MRTLSASVAIIAPLAALLAAPQTIYEPELLGVGKHAGGETVVCARHAFRLGEKADCSGIGGGLDEGKAGAGGSLGQGHGGGVAEEGTRTVEAYRTEYSVKDSCHNPNEKGECLMADGRVVYEGAVACPRWLPLGTKVEIDGRGHVCSDRYAKWLDAKRGLPTFDVFTFGKPTGLKRVKVKILGK